MAQNLFTPRQRMLNAYKGVFSDRPPVAPEFWYYYPAKVLGVGMMELEREIPFWQALQTTFRKYGTEGWGAVFPAVTHPDVKKTVKLKKISETQYRETVFTEYGSARLEAAKIYDAMEPSWVEKHIAGDEKELELCIDMALSMENRIDYASMTDAYNKVGEDYLLEVWMGMPFFDFIAERMGFEKAVLYFISTDEEVLQALRERYTSYQKEFIRRICENTPYESFVIGCSYSCNSLIGPGMWRKWDKPFIRAMAEELHRHGKLLHVHFHGRSMDTASDFAEMGIDCVCPFERGPGGDVDGIEGLKEIRRRLGGRVTMNGNIHTVNTLIRGTAEDVRREVREIREAFEGAARIIIGTGDQVGRETPEENILAMVEEAKK